TSMPLNRVRGGVFGPILRTCLPTIAARGLTVAGASSGARFDLFATDRRSNCLIGRASFPKTVSDFSGCAQWELAFMQMGVAVLVLVIACGVLSVLFAIWAIRSVLAADQGTQRMQEIAEAIREGASAYLTRQYSTIAIVGVVVFLAAWYLLSISEIGRASCRESGEAAVGGGTLKEQVE